MIETLPTEVSIQILSNLRLVEIQRLRRVCRQFRELIDDPSTQHLWIEAATPTAFARLRNFVQSTLTFDQTTTFVTAVTRILVQHRDICAMPDARHTWFHHLDDFTHLWYWHRRRGLVQLLHQGERAWSPGDVHQAALAMAWAHAQHHEAPHNHDANTSLPKQLTPKSRSVWMRGRGRR